LVRSLIEPDVFDNSVPFDNSTPIYLINMLWKLCLGLALDLEVHILAFYTENNENEHVHLSSANFTEGNILLKERTQTINNKIELN